MLLQSLRTQKPRRNVRPFSIFPFPPHSSLFIPAEAREPREGGRGRGGRGGRGDRGDRGARGGRGRPFDRHSQTGKTYVSFLQIFLQSKHPISDSEKKIHQSWGGDDGNTEFKTEQAAVVDAAAEATGAGEWGAEPAPAADWGAPVAEASADAWATPADAAPAAEGDKAESRPRREREPEEEDNTLTLDQYLAQQKDKDSIVPKLEVRKANDGADDIFKDAVAVAKNEEDDVYFAGKVRAACRFFLLLSF